MRQPGYIGAVCGCIMDEEAEASDWAEYSQFREIAVLAVLV